jgi:hypothetical protein
MHTEDDLKVALLDFVERNEPDTHAVRAEIEHRLSTSSRRDHLGGQRGRWTLLISVAACIAVVVAMAVGFSLGRSHSVQPPAETLPPTSAPTVLGAHQFPGTVVLSQFQGTGSQTLEIGQHSVPASSELAAVFLCHGKGSIDIAHRISTSCSDNGTGGLGLDDGTRTLQITVAAATTWKVALIVQPKIQTNGSVGYPDFVFNTNDTGLGSGTGRGDGTIQLTPAATGPYVIWLKCTGTGVTITSPTRPTMKDYTKTCFDGYDYEWTVAKGAATGELEIAAAAGTTWSILVLPA